jgi:peroxiredoxin
LVGFEKEKATLDELGAKVFAISVDAEDKAQEVQDEVSFPVAFGATREQGDAVGAWWGEQRGGIIQPSEFVVGADGKVMASAYSAGPLSRLDAGDVVRWIQFHEKRAREAAAGKS